MDFSTFKKERVTEVAASYGIDIFIASLPENIWYLTEFPSLGQRLLNSSQTFVVYNVKTHEKFYVSSASDVPTIMESCEYAAIFPVGQFQFYIPHTDGDFAKKLSKNLAVRYSSASEALAAAVKAAGGETKTIGFDLSRVKPPFFDEITQKIPQAKIVSAADYFYEIRLIKHSDEIALLERSANITEEALFEAVQIIKPGVSELEIANAFNCGVTKRGAVPYFCVVTIDERAAFSDTSNMSFQKVQDGSVIRFDLGCLYKNYQSDIARTAIVGKNDKAENYYKWVREGTEKAIAAMKSGVTAGEIFDIAESTVQKGMPHYKRHHTGHGIGIELYDLPSVVHGNKTVLRENMVLCIETPYYEIGWGGVQIEDTVVVQKNGAKYLTKSSRDLMKL